MYTCFHCGKTLEVERHVGFRDECPFCRESLHVCLNCSFYAPGAYNDCKESSAERVLVKDRANKCEYFKFKSGPAGAASDQAKARRLAEQLFKK